MGTVEFLGVTYDRDSLPATLLTYIDAYNDALEARVAGPVDVNDYVFRMNQALQMFGASAVADAIEALAQAEGVELS